MQWGCIMTPSACSGACAAQRARRELQGARRGLQRAPGPPGDADHQRRRAAVGPAPGNDPLGAAPLCPSNLFQTPCNLFSPCPPLITSAALAFCWPITCFAHRMCIRPVQQDSIEYAVVIKRGSRGLIRCQHEHRCVRSFARGRLGSEEVVAPMARTNIKRHWYVLM